VARDVVKMEFQEIVYPSSNWDRYLHRSHGQDSHDWRNQKSC